MKNDKILFMLGDISDDLIVEASYEQESCEQKPTKKESGLYRRIGAIAACFLLAVGALILPNALKERQPSDIIVDLDYNCGYNSDDILRLIGEKSSSAGEIEIAIVSKVMSEIKDEAFSDYKSGIVIDEKYVGAELGSVTVSAYLHEYDEDKDSEFEEINATVYEIDGVSPDFAVCLKYTEQSIHFTTEHYYVWRNKLPEISSFEEFSQAFDLAEHLQTKKISYIKKDGYADEGETNVYYISESARGELKGKLVALKGAAVILDNETGKALAGMSYLSIDSELKSAGTLANRMLVFENGYLIEMMGENAYVFRIDSAADKITDYVSENGSVSYSYKNIEYGVME